MSFRAGQRWNYRTREEDVGSLLTVLRVEELPDLGEVVFISVQGVRVVAQRAPGGLRTEIGFTELTSAALTESVTSLHSEGPVPEHEKLYEGWRRSFDSGNATAYREPVASIVGKFQSIFQAVANRNRATVPATSSQRVEARLEDVDEQTVRLVLDDILEGGARALFTHLELRRDDLAQGTFSPELAAQIGENILIRLVATNRR